MERGRERRKGRVVVRWRLYEPSPRCGEGQAAGVRCCSTPLAYSVALSLGLESTVTFPSPTAKDEPAAALHRNLPRHSAPCIKPVTNKDPQFNSTAADAATFVYLQQRPPMQTNYPRPQTCQCYEGSSTPAQSTPNVSPSPFQPPRPLHPLTLCLFPETNALVQLARSSVSLPPGILNIPFKTAPYP